MFEAMKKCCMESCSYYQVASQQNGQRHSSTPLTSQQVGQTESLIGSATVLWTCMYHKINLDVIIQ